MSISILVSKGECQRDTDCSNDKACINNFCVNPCTVSQPCGESAICEAISHRPVCKCPPGYAGDPHTVCYTCTSTLQISFHLLIYCIQSNLSVF